MNRNLDSTVWSLSSPAETIALGRIIGESLVGGMVIGLIGELGAGKTHLVKGIAQGNAEKEHAPEVTSPTFTLAQQYAGRLTLHHLDAYRLKSVDELLAIGFDELCGSGGVVIVEWANRVIAAFPDDRLMLTMTVTGETCRSIVAKATGSLSQSCLSAIQQRWIAHGSR